MLTFSEQYCIVVARYVNTFSEFTQYQSEVLNIVRVTTSLISTLGVSN